MISRLALAAALLAAATGFAFGQDTTPTQEEAKPAVAAPQASPIDKDTSGPAGIRRANIAKMMDEAYKASGASDDQIKKLKDLETKMREARTSRNMDEIKKLREEREKILTPEQQKAMREYIVNKRRAAFQESGETTAPKP